jgi:predicted phosphoribosyltransferase
MVFENRLKAAEQLAERLSGYRGQRPLVLGVPRGALPMARLIADRLEGELDVVLVHKLRAPDQPELAIGSIDESGQVFLADFLSELRVTPAQLETERQTQLEALRRRRSRYTPVRPPIDPAGRTVIIVDDGIATGATMIAAIRAIRARTPARIVVATAVAPPETVRKLEQEADEVVCLDTPVWFRAIGQFFADFSEVSDAEAIAALQEGGRREVAGSAR